MSDEKIVILGGGSPFVPSMIYAMLENKELLEGSEVCLMDIDPTRLSLLTKLGEELSRRRKMKFKFTKTTDSKEALEDATFVMPSYRIGGEEHMRYDFEIPTKHGIYGDETAGPGGTFMAQCTIPATLKYCRLIEDLCPEAWVISYVNPTNFVLDAVQRETRMKFIAICDCFAGFAMRFLPALLKMPPLERRYCVNDDIRPRAIGVNHLTWLVDLLVNGEDGYPLLKERIRKAGRTERLGFRTSDFSMRLLEAYGYLNICPGHCQMLWEHHSVIERRKKWLESRERISFLGWNEKAWELVRDVVDGAKYDVRQPRFNPTGHARHVIGIMTSIIGNEGREWGGINFKNRGAITNLPEDSIVEGPCLVDKRGVTPINMGDLPKCFLGLTLHIINWQELTVDAALSGDRDLLYQALLACPYVHDMDPAQEIMQELLEAHAEHMPQFQKIEKDRL